jgi:hypothetical protein
VTKNSNMFIRKATVYLESGLRKGSYNLHGSNSNTFKVQKVEKFDGIDEYYLKTYLRYDEMNVNINRYDYTWLTLIALLGGLQGVFREYFRVIAIGISRRVFMDSVLQDIFYIKKR